MSKDERGSWFDEPTMSGPKKAGYDVSAAAIRPDIWKVAQLGSGTCL
jgi:hypothetical protein